MPTQAGWRLEIGSAPAPEVLDVDAVVLAVPPPSARRLLSREVAEAAEGYATIELASMAVVAMAFPPATELPEASGVLIAAERPGRRRHSAGRSGDASARAGFYSDLWGPLPYALGRVPPDRYVLREIHGPLRPVLGP